MDDEPRVAFDIDGISSVIVNAVAVERQRGVTEEEKRCGSMRR